MKIMGNQLNWKMHNNLKNLQNEHERMVFDYTKMEWFDMQQEKTITSLERTYQ